MAFRRLAWLFVGLAILFGTATAAAEGTIAWTVTGGPTGGSVNALVAAPNVPGLLFAGTNGGVYITRDGGMHWQMASDGLPDDRVILALATAPDASVVFAGTRNGVYRTRNSGVSWTATNQRLTDQPVLSLLLDPRDPSRVYAGTATTLYRSENSGDTWTDIGRELSPGQIWALALTPDSSTLFSAIDTGVYTSRDRGAHWTRASEGLPEGVRVQAFAIVGRGVIAGTTRGLYRSTDGRLWSAIAGSVSGIPVRPVLSDPKSDRVFAVTAQGLARSRDGGATWTMMPNAPGDAPVSSLAFGDNGAFYLGTARGVWITLNDGETWQLVNAGLVSTGVSALLAAPSNPESMLAATHFGLWLTRNRGDTWLVASGVSDPYVISLAADPNTPKLVYVGTWGSSVFVSPDGGATFSRLVENLSNNAPIAALAVVHPKPETTVLYAGTLGNGVLHSSDGGRTFASQSAGLGNNPRVNVLAFVSPFLYAGTDGGLYRLDPANSSAQWKSVARELPTDEVRAIVGDVRDPRSIFALFASGGLYHSGDQGTKWRPVDRSVFPTRIRFYAFTQNPSRANVMYLGTDRGIYRTDDGGVTWIASNGGLPPGAEVLAIAVDPQSPERILAGTTSSGVVAGIDHFPILTSNGLALGSGLALLLVVGVAVVVWRERLSPVARELRWTREWPEWEEAITSALWTFGQANEVNLHEMPRRQLTRALEYFVEQHPDDALTLQADPLALRLDNYLIAQRFLSHWKAAWEMGDNAELFIPTMSQMVDQLCALLGFARVDERTYKGLIGYVVRAPALRLKIPSRFPIIFIPRHEVDEQDISALRDLMGVLNMTSYFALIIDLRDVPAQDSHQSLKPLVRQAIHDFIVLDGRDIRNLFAARDHGRRLIEIILDQVDLTVVSPYVTSGPVPENMFFGREHELKTIVRTVRDANFAIVGGRKIGKTSVLARVHRLLQDAPECQPFYLDCQAIHTDHDFYEAIETLWRQPLPGHTPEGFRQMALELLRQYPNRSIVMLFDEIDALLRCDIREGERLFRVLRALSQENQIRYIFCGEKTLSAALRNPELVFFNFCNAVPLSYLSPAEARRVVIEPMQELGIGLDGGSALADELVEKVTGHPNIVQYVCQKLIERINLRRDRVITRADVDALVQSAQFAEYFAAISWGNANSLERLVSLLMLAQTQVTAGEMGELLRARGVGATPARLESAFDGLCLYSILRRDGPKYAFAAPAIPQILQRSQDVNGLLTSLVKEIQTSNGTL